MTVIISGKDNAQSCEICLVLCGMDGEKGEG